jgi:hypothetical protein
MDERALRNEVEQDLRLAATRKVVYLEGVEDVAVLIGLLGHTPPSDVPDEGYDVDGVWLRGLPATRRGRGSGSTAVQDRVRVADKFGYRGVRGVVDGDGLAVDTLPAAVDAPISAPLQRWRTYCIENLLVQVGWPFGPEPAWRTVFADYVPYAALGRVVRWLHADLYARGVAGFREPDRSKPLVTLDGVRERLRQDEADSRKLRDLVAFFDEEVARCEAALAEDDPHLARAHALINGKWLVVDHAPRRSGLGADECRRAWARHAGATGGHPDIRGWWRRLVAL